ncbi:hypothetical protein [Demequina capsici]|uniref:Ribulose-phosphate 3-epimerase n=1 Tax=Demequina capsici TaxID=3075620 RepID=A0AA96J5Y0_9MICO|nr:hypothetical protein [Demequina sp. OYTSA14]WNM23592.1 hypothetical protein RN606_09465 [Demequina sp. OYTSA14]
MVHVDSPGWREAIDEIRAHGVRPAVALNPNTPLDALPADVTDILIMSIETGHAGAPFDDEAIRRSASLHNARPLATLGWDGGVNAERFRDAALSGVGWLISGGSLFNSPDIAARIQTAIAHYDVERMHTTPHCSISCTMCGLLYTERVLAGRIRCGFLTRRPPRNTRARRTSWLSILL